MIDAGRALQKAKCRILAVEVTERETQDRLTHQDELHYRQILNRILLLLSNFYYRNSKSNFRLPYGKDQYN